MKIISKHQDYYDSVRAYGADPNVFYKRIESVVSKSKSGVLFSGSVLQEMINQAPMISRHHEAQRDPSICDMAFIFFCGKIYPCFVFDWKINNKTYLGHCYDYTQVENLIRRRGTKQFKKYWFKKDTDNYYFPSNKKRIPTIFDFAKKEQKNKDVLRLHHELGTPVFCVTIKNGEWSIVLNPILKKYKFYKVFDTFRTYQEISMFISGIMGGQSPPMVEISDRCRKEMHGFDKWSFRKEPVKTNDSTNRVNIKKEINDKNTN